THLIPEGELMRWQPVCAALAFGLVVTPPSPAQVPAKYKPTIKKGLEWLARAQNKRTGSWEGSGGNYPVAMTGLAGMALLSEGSTVQQGKYSKNLRKARDWLISQSQPNGLITNPRDSAQGARYMYGHGFALLFLSSVYGEERDVEKRKKL